MKCREIWKEVKSGNKEDLPQEIQDVLDKHTNHEFELVQYGGVYYAIECISCHEVLFDDETEE